MNFIFHEILLNFQELKESYNRFNLINIIYDILNSYNIMNKLFYIMIDNVSTNKSILKNLERMIIKRKRIK